MKKTIKPKKLNWYCENGIYGTSIVPAFSSLEAMELLALEVEDGKGTVHFIGHFNHGNGYRERYKIKTAEDSSWFWTVSLTPFTRENYN